MKKISLVATLLLGSMYALAQDSTSHVVNDTTILDNDSTIFVQVENMPLFPSATNAIHSKSLLAQHLANEVKKYKGKYKFSGTVYINFIIEKDGSISSPLILRGSFEDQNAIAKEIIMNLPRFSPGSQKGTYVRLSTNVGIKFP